MSTVTTNSSSSRQQQNAFFVHTSPTDFLATTRAWLLANERRANIILPHAEKLKEQEQEGTLASGQFWVTAWSASPPKPLSTPPAHRGPHLDFVLACTEGHMGTYPLFLFSTHDIVTLPEQWLDQYMHQLAQKLMTLVDPARVFSIFGQERAVQMLCSHWSNLTGFRPGSQPYYEASSTYCTPETFASSRSTPEAGHVMRKAVPSDLDQVARLCQEFAEDSVSRYYSRFRLNCRLTIPQPPFTLSTDQAKREARYLIHHGLLWVYIMDGGALSTIVAVTRSSSQVAGITKVYTAPQFRRRGCADRLVAHVCEQSVYLRGSPLSCQTLTASAPAPSRQFKDGKSYAVLFVGHALPAARVYNRVGFVGVGTSKGQHCVQDSNVERWLELGFEGTRTGHW